jgi:phenylacetate-CoA ligase
MQMDLYKNLIAEFIYPVSLRLMGLGGRIRYHSFLKEREYSSLAENLLLQKARLFRIVDYSMHEIPYYRELAKKNEIEIHEETIFSDLRKFPILEKRTIKNNFESLRNHSITKYRKNTSGGSTGEPAVFLHDHNYRVENATAFADSLSGFNVGDKNIRLWGSEKEILADRKDFGKRILNRLINRTVFLNSFCMSDEIMNSYVSAINRYGPKVIIAYAQSIFELSKHIEEKNIEITSPLSIISSAGTLFPFMREKIESVFDCNVFNRYGSREVSNIAMECSAHHGLHLNIFNHYIEILNSKGEEVKEGERGEIIVTLLTNKIMPLIRYRIGDLGVKTTRSCSCGRGLPLLKSVKGRTVNLFKTKKDKFIDGEYFTHLFYFVDFIRRFQVVQMDIDNILVNIELDKSKKRLDIRQDLENFTFKIRKVMGDDCKVEYAFVDEIKPSKSGKYIYTLSNVN